jgi:hypothetical protein
MEQEIPILHPLSSIFKEISTQEPVPSNNMVVTQETTTQEEIVPQATTILNLAATQEPATQVETIPQELVGQE